MSVVQEKLDIKSRKRESKRTGVNKFHAVVQLRGKLRALLNLITRIKKTNYENGEGYIGKKKDQ